MSIPISKLPGLALLLALVAGGALGSCRPPRGVPAGPATQPTQAEGDDDRYPEVPQGMSIVPDSTIVISPPNSQEVFYRTLVTVAFDDTTSAPSVRRILAHYGTVVGGDETAGPRGTYLLQVQDRGVDWSRVSAMLDSLRTEGGVEKAALLPRPPKS
ncbi:MAG TPA: hypothetical protein VFO95_13230 [Gemmatimonadales bacterium]|nr:hypothetical protein [Gemmatimonadales bacterium]